jgi:hypothetical protein
MAVRSGWARNRGDWEIKLELAHQSCEIQDLNRAFMKEMERDRGVGTRGQGIEGRLESVEKEFARRSTLSPSG